MSYKIFLVLAALLLSGCGQPQPQVSIEAAVEVAETSDSASLKAKLELADRLDGVEDHTVANVTFVHSGRTENPISQSK